MYVFPEMEPSTLGCHKAHTLQISVIVHKILSPARSLGRYVMLLFHAFSTMGDVRMYRKNTADQAVSIGFASIPIVALAALFSGAVTTVQAAYQLVSPFIPKSVIGAIVAPSIILELGVVVPAFLLAGRVGARITAEIGTMRVTEQIDALEVMGLNSLGYLVVPRVVAGVVMFPMLYVIACVVGIGGSIVIADLGGWLSRGDFITGARSFFQPFDVVFGLIKAVSFGFIITTISCYKGYYTKGGAEGVGRATTEAAVLSCVYILVADLLLALMLL